MSAISASHVTVPETPSQPLKPFKRMLPIILMLIFISLFVLSCGSTPRPEGKDFLSVENNYGLKGSGRGTAFVSPWAKKKIYHKVAVMPFRAPVELVGASIADMATTEILKTYKYELIERSQIEQILEEQSLGMKGVTQSTLAMEVGNILGVQGVIVGTVPEYGMRAIGSLELPAIGINIRMIDAETGSIIWTVTDSAISQKPISISAFARHLVDSMVHRLQNEWIAAGDTFAVTMPSPQIISHKGRIRSAVIEVFPDSTRMFKSYTLMRSRTQQGPYLKMATMTNKTKRIIFEDKNLLDAETYYYKVAATSVSGLNGPPAGPIAVTTAGAPDPIIDFWAENNRIRKIRLTWAPSLDPAVSGYAIYRANQKGGPFTKIATIKNSSSKAFVDKGKDLPKKKLKDGTKYFYKIQAINVVNIHSPNSPVISAVTRGAPAVVTGFEAESNLPRKVALKWTRSDDPVVKRYALYRSLAEFGPFEKISFIDDIDKNQFMDKGKGGSRGDTGNLKDNTQYYYKIKVLNVVNVPSPDSSTISAITKPVPVLVSNFIAGQSEVKQVSLSWAPNPEADIAKYEIRRGTSPQSIKKKVKEMPGSTSNYIDPKLKDGRTYFYKIRAIDRDGLKSVFSESVESTTKPIPQTPVGLNVALQGQQVKITWHKNPESDITHYNVFKKGFLTWEPAGTSVETEFFYSKDLKKGKEVTFRVTAVDETNLESKPSEEIKIKIPK